MTPMRDRLVTLLVAGTAGLLGRLPDRPLHRAAMALGAGCYLLMARRRSLARQNLRRVCTSLAARGLGGPAVSAAARDSRALERLVRAAFGHWLRGYLEVLLAPRYTEAYLRERLTFEESAAVDAAIERIRGGERTIFIGAHFGCMELPALFGAVELGVPAVAPMETIRNASLDEWLSRRRGTAGIRIVPLDGAARVLRAALARGEILALVADRDISGTGRAATLFDAPARLPVGPAILTLESGAAAYVVGVRRTGSGDYVGRLFPLPAPQGRSLRERVDAFLAAETAAFERLIADAPEQWWTVLFPVWEAEVVTTGQPVAPARAEVAR
jgi:KDO2-lipid IV(A) lauroyltransferase